MLYPAELRGLLRSISMIWQPLRALLNKGLAGVGINVKSALPVTGWVRSQGVQMQMVLGLPYSLLSKKLHRDRFLLKDGKIY